MIQEQGFFPLAIPVPPQLEEAFGYPGRFHPSEETLPRYVAFYWTEGADEASYSVKGVLAHRKLRGFIPCKQAFLVVTPVC